jgi:hypothetical protein
MKKQSKNIVSLLGLFACATLASACGSTNEIAGDRDPVVGAGDDGNDDSGGAASAGGAATSTGGLDDPNGSVSHTVPDGGDVNACDRGFAQDAGGTRVCAATYGGKCFESDAFACQCAGCGDACVVAESYPTQISCSIPERCQAGFLRDRGGSKKCNYTVNSLCFENGDDACTCAGCADGKCLSLESYPAMVRCE